jgi:hypothetical protein
VQMMRAGSRARSVASTVAVFVLLLSGCPPGIGVTMFNATAEGLVVVAWDKEYPIAAGGSAVMPLTDRITVRYSSASHEYCLPDDLQYEGRGYVDYRAFRGRAMKAEIRPDRAIYILPATAIGPGPTPYARQREGFPVRGCPATSGRQKTTPGNTKG